jgi:hypothetical protein
VKVTSLSSKHKNKISAQWCFLETYFYLHCVQLVLRMPFHLLDGLRLR